MHYELDVFKTAVDLLRLAVRIVRTLPRDCKPDIPRRLMDRAEEIHELIRQANATRGDRVPFRDEIVKHLEKLKILVRALHDEEIVAHDLWQQSNRLTTSLGKQLYGWIE